MNDKLKVWGRRTRKILRSSAAKKRMAFAFVLVLLLSQLLGALAPLAQAGGFHGPTVALADDDGGGGGGNEGTEGGSTNSAANGAEFIWFDRGGFVDTASGRKFDAEQGYGRASADFFWNKLVARMSSNPEMVGGGGSYNAAHRFSDTGLTSQESFYAAADEAIARAIQRNNAMGGTSTRARVVAVGWAWTQHEGSGVWNFVNTGILNQRTFEYLIPRAGNSTELPAAVGWSDPVDATGFAGQSWRDYIYNIGKRDLTGKNYRVVVLAVTDDEPAGEGDFQLTKASSSPDITTGNSCYSFEGATFEVFSDAACTKKVGTLVAGANGKTNILENLPRGDYWVKETVAPRGYELSTSTQKVTVIGGKLNTATFKDNPLGDPGNALVQKISEDGNRYGIQGTEFTVKYYDNAEGDASGNALRTWTFETDEDGYVRFHTDWKTGGDELFKNASGAPFFPVGTYAVQETKASKGYRLTDDSVHIAIVTVDDGGHPVWTLQDDWNSVNFDEVDPEYDGKTAYNEAAPRIETTLTERDEHYASSAHTVDLVDVVEYTYCVIGREYRVTGILMDKETGEPLLDVEGNELTAETTFTAEARDGSVEVVFKDVDATLFKNVTTVAFETMYEDGVEIAVHADIDDAAQTVYFPEAETTLADEEGNHEVLADGETTVVDTVVYKNLKPGVEHVVTGTLMDKATGEPIPGPDGEPITVTQTFIPETKNGTVELTFTFDGSYVAGKWGVAFESITRDGYEVAVHADIEDEAQTDNFPGIETTLTDKEDGDDHVKASEETVVVDTVEYSALLPNTAYTMRGKLMDKETGEPLLDVEGNELTAELEFETDETGNGTVELEFAVDTSLLIGAQIVAFESLYNGEREVAIHADLDDPAQTVGVPEIGTVLADKGGNKTVLASSPLVDTVSYRGLKPGQEYTVTGTLMDKATGQAIHGADGKPISVDAKFTPEESEGKTEVVFEGFGEFIAGRDVVAFEKVHRDGIEIAVHADIEDEAQTVKVPDARTTLKASDGSKIIKPEGKVTLVDTVVYTNLEPGKTYTVTGTLMDKATGSALGIAGATASKSFMTDQTGNGTVELSFTIDANAVAGKKVVAFESVADNGREVAVHADIDDPAQTVTVEQKPPVTVTPPFSQTGTGVAAVALAAAGLAAAIAAATWVSGKRVTK